MALKRSTKAYRKKNNLYIPTEAERLLLDDFINNTSLFAAIRDPVLRRDYKNIWMYTETPATLSRLGMWEKNTAKSQYFRLFESAAINLYSATNHERFNRYGPTYQEEE